MGKNELYFEEGKSEGGGRGRDKRSDDKTNG
jgi:hypothetical protein